MNSNVLKLHDSFWEIYEMLGDFFGLIVRLVFCVGLAAMTSFAILIGPQAYTIYHGGHDQGESWMATLPIALLAFPCIVAGLWFVAAVLFAARRL